MKRLVIASLLATGLLAGAQAQSPARAQAVTFTDNARVRSVDPQYENISVPRNECSSRWINEDSYRGGANQDRHYGGAIVGGLAGKGVAEMIDPTVEDAYWRENYSSRPYITTGSTYDDYGPAYRYGVSSYGKYDSRTFEEVEGDLGRDWNQTRGTSRLDWDRAKYAAKDSWQRVSDTIERAVPGDSDRDGK